MFKTYRRRQVANLHKMIGLRVTNGQRRRAIKRYEKAYRSYVLQYREDPITGQPIEPGSQI